MSSRQAKLRERFEREARTISSLDHPHICTLYDIGRQDGIDFIVMELLEGEVLADRLRGGAMPLDRAIRSGIEIAEALHEAHRSGVIHRDLKPGNVMLSRHGVKRMDFGLARIVSRSAAALAKDASSTTTADQELTRDGTLLGTVPYMAPEPLEGKVPDARSDVFALGNVLY